MAKVRKKFDKGIRLKDTDDALTLEGEISVSTTDPKLKARVDGATRDVVTEDQTQTVTNKTIDATDATGTNTVSLDASDATYNNATSGLAATDAQAAIDENDANLDAHMADTVDAHDASAISYNNATSGLVATEAQAAIDENDANLDAHISDAVDAHDASAISYNNVTSGLTATETQAAIDEVEGRVDAAETAMSDHLDDTVDAHDASAISNIPSGNLIATDQQAVNNELQSDIDTRALGSDLTAHINDVSDAHDSSAISYNNAISGLASVDVQEAIDEVDADLDAHVIDTTTHGVTSDIVGKDDAQTLTNKTIAAQIMTGVTRNSGVLKTDVYQDAVTTGADATMAIYGSSIVRLEHASLTSLAMVASPEEGKELTIINATGVDISIKNDTGGTAANRILTGTKADIALKDEASITIKYDDNELRWMVVGGVGGEAGGDTDVDVMFVDNFDATTIGDYAITGAASITDTALEVINGDQSLKLDHTAAVSAKRTIAVPNKFRGKQVRMELDISSNATSGNVTATIVDETNVVTLVNADSLEPYSGTGSEKRRIWWEMPETCASLSYEFDGLIEASAITIIDDIQIEKEFSVSTQTTTDELLKENEFSARIANNGTASVTSQSSNFIQSVNRTVLGNVLVTFVPGFFTEIPSLTASVDIPVDAAGITAVPLNLTTSSVTIMVRNDGITAHDKPFMIQVQNQGVDYDANLIRRVETKDTFSEIVVEQDRDISEINEFSAICTGTAVTSSNANFIQSVATISTGVYEVTYVTDTFSVEPSVTFAPAIEGGTEIRTISGSTDATKVRIAFFNSAGAAAGASPFYIHVSRQGSDVYNKTLTRIKTNPNQKIKIPSSEMRLEGATSRGTGAETFIVKFNSLVKSIGGNLLLDNSNGTKVICKKDGLLNISAALVCTATHSAFVSKNQAVMTTYPTASEAIQTSSGSTGFANNLSGTFPVKAGDIIRIGSDGVPNGNVTNHIELYFQEQEIQVGVSNILPKFSETDACVSVYGYNGYGSTNTTIPRLSTFAVNSPNGKIAYTDTATDGNAFEILEDGTFNFSCFCRVGTSNYINMGFSLNSSSLSTSIINIPEAEILVSDTTYAINGFTASANIQRTFSKGDIVRLHMDADAVLHLSATVSQVGKPNITAVDVTPFADLPLLDTGFYHAQHDTNTDITTVHKDTATSDFLTIDDTTVANRIRVIAKKDCVIDAQATLAINNGTYEDVRVAWYDRNGVLLAQEYNRSDLATFAPAVTASVSIELSKGDYIEYEKGLSGGSFNAGYITVSAIGQSNKIVTEQDSNLSDWVDYTPTLQGFGSATIDYARWKVFGDSILLMASFTAGTTQAIQAQMTLPNNYLVSSTSPVDMLLGVGERDTVSAGVNLLSSPNNQFINFGATQLAGGLSSQLGSQIVGSGEKCKFSIIIPIEGLSSEAKTLVAIKKIKRSSSEYDTGEEWIDGRKIYARDYYNAGPIGDGVMMTIDSGLDVIKLDCTYLSSYGGAIASGYYSSPDDTVEQVMQYYPASGNLYFRSIGLTATKVYTRIKYVK